MVTFDDRDSIGRTSFTADKIPVGRTVRDTFRVIGRGWLTFYGLSLIVVIISLPFGILYAQRLTEVLAQAQDASRAGVRPTMPQASVLWEIGAFYIVQSLASLYAFAAITDGAGRVLADGEVDLARSLKAGLVRLLPMVVAAIVFYLGFLLALVLVIVPGFIFGAAYGLAPTLCVLERRGPFASFSRSAELTRGNRWRCIGITLLMLAGPAIVVAIINKLLTSAIGVRYGLVVTLGVNFFVLPIYYVFPTVLTNGLKRLKEGGAPSAVADIF